MKWVSSAMGILSTVLLVYLLLITVYIALSWFSIDRSLPFVRFLAAVSEPYLRWFRRFSFLKWGQLDVSPVLALAILWFLSDVTRDIAIAGSFSVGIVLSSLFRHVLGAAAGLFLLLAALSFVRFLAIRFRWGVAELWAFLDSILQPPAYAVGRIVRPKSFVPYPTTLLVLTLSSLAVGVVGLVLAFWSQTLLPQLPF